MTTWDVYIPDDSRIGFADDYVYLSGGRNRVILRGDPLEAKLHFPGHTLRMINTSAMRTRPRTTIEYLVGVVGNARWNGRSDGPPGSCRSPGDAQLAQSALPHTLTKYVVYSADGATKFVIRLKHGILMSIEQPQVGPHHLPPAGFDKIIACARNSYIRQFDMNSYAVNHTPKQCVTNITFLAIDGATRLDPYTSGFITRHQFGPNDVGLMFKHIISGLGGYGRPRYSVDQLTTMDPRGDGVVYPAGREVILNAMPDYEVIDNGLRLHIDTNAIVDCGLHDIIVVGGRRLQLVAA